MYVGDNGSLSEFTDAAPTKDNLKTLHKTIKKVAEDIENFSFNTSVSTFMICVNELIGTKMYQQRNFGVIGLFWYRLMRHILQKNLWEKLGNTERLFLEAPFPKFDASQYLVESSKEYPISFNGKMRFKH